MSAPQSRCSEVYWLKCAQLFSWTNLTTTVHNKYMRNTQMALKNISRALWSCCHYVLLAQEHRKSLTVRHFYAGIVSLSTIKQVLWVTACACASPQPLCANTDMTEDGDPLYSFWGRGGSTTLTFGCISILRRCHHISIEPCFALWPRFALCLLLPLLWQPFLLWNWSWSTLLLWYPSN